MDVIKRYQEISKHENDCWALALSRAFKKDYDEIYNLMKPFVNENGTLYTHFIYGILQKNGWQCFRTKSKLKNIVLHKDYDEMLIKIKNHVLYVNNGTIYSYNSSDENYETMLNSLTERVYVIRN